MSAIKHWTSESARLDGGSVHAHHLPTKSRAHRLDLMDRIAQGPVTNN
jgi:hypothetical protein